MGLDHNTVTDVSVLGGSAGEENFISVNLVLTALDDLRSVKSLLKHFVILSRLSSSAPGGDPAVDTP